MVEKNNRFQIVVHFIMILLCVFCLFPFLLLVVSSFADEQQLIRDG